MLAHSPPLPLIIDYYEYDDITAGDEEAIILALEQRDRVCRIRFNIPVLKLQRLITAIDEEYPILENLILVAPPEDKSTVLILPRNTSSTSFTSRDDQVFHSNTVPITYDCCWPRHTQSYLIPPIHLLPTHCSAPVAFIDAPAGYALDFLSLCRPQP